MERLEGKILNAPEAPPQFDRNQCNVQWSWNQSRSKWLLVIKLLSLSIYQSLLLSESYK